MEMKTRANLRLTGTLASNKGGGLAFGNAISTVNTTMRVSEKGTAAAYCLVSTRDSDLVLIGYRNGANRVASLLTNDPNIDPNVWDVDNRNPPRPIFQLAYGENAASDIPPVVKNTISVLLGFEGATVVRLVQLTTHQNHCQMWHNLRRFLLTSSTVHFVVNVLLHRFYEFASGLNEQELDQCRRIIYIIRNVLNVHISFALSEKLRMVLNNHLVGRNITQNLHSVIDSGIKPFGCVCFSDSICVISALIVFSVLLRFTNPNLLVCI